MFNVNGTEWNIAFVKPNSRQLCRSDGTLTIGVCDNNTKTIYINQNLNNYMLMRVLTHEMVHVFCFEYDVSMDIETEEVVADFMSLFGADIIENVNYTFKLINRIIG